MIREIYSGGSSNDSYVMLQASGPEQNQVTGFTLRAYSPVGGVLGTKTFQSDVANSQGQMALLIADTSFATEFPTAPEPDLIMPSLDLNPSAGAVCWDAYDCVAWGNFTGTNLPSPFGQPALAVGGSQRVVLDRSVSAGCPGALDADDDTDSSLNDFIQTGPNPRANSTHIVETECDAPSTAIDSGPQEVTTSTSADFAVHSIPAGADLECRLRGQKFVPCPAGTASYPSLGEGLHQFQARSRNGSNPAGAPAAFNWKIDLTPPTTTIDVPLLPTPNPGPAVTFYFSADEEATFECSMVASGSSEDYHSCTTQKTYADLADGSYEFNVRATDLVNHLGPAVSYDFTVDSTLLDRVPPETTITSHPTDPSGEKSATFTYMSSEPESMFQCSFDNGPFEFCWDFGITYDHLGAGVHTFQVRARDEKANVDLTPASYTFTVAFAPLAIEIPPRQGFPDTSLTSKPKAKSRNRTPTITFSSSTPGATFQCQLDGRAFKACSSPLTPKPLAYGKHTFRVISLLDGVPDPTPAGCSFEVKKAKPKHRRKSRGSRPVSG